MHKKLNLQASVLRATIQINPKKYLILSKNIQCESFDIPKTSNIPYFLVFFQNMNFDRILLKLPKKMKI